MSRVPPSDLDAEGVVLSACILVEDGYDRCQPILTAADFYADANGRIYGAIAKLRDAGKQVDLVAVSSLLRDEGRLAQVGGAVYLAQICDGTPAVAHLEQHARAVRDKARVRRLIAESQRIAAEGYADVGVIEDWLQQSESAVFEATRTADVEDSVVSLADAIDAELKAVTARTGGVLAGPATGFRLLDRLLLGLRGSSQYVLAARPGVGKTALALKVSINVAQQKKRPDHAVVYVSAEMPREQVAERMLSIESGVDLRKLAVGSTAKNPITAAEWERIRSAGRRLAALPIQIEDSAGPTVSQIRSSIRRAMSKLRAAHGPELKLGLVVVDYLQILNGDRQRGESREVEVSNLSKRLLWLAREFRVPTLVLSQLNRDIERREDKDPTLADLRESGSIEQDAFSVIFLSRPTQDTPLVKVTIAKQRQGPTGVLNLFFDGRCTRFCTSKEEAELVDPEEFWWGTEDDWDHPS